jgi:hypothetical protein
MDKKYSRVRKIRSNFKRDRLRTVGLFCCFLHVDKCENAEIHILYRNYHGNTYKVPKVMLSLSKHITIINHIEGLTLMHCPS